MYMYLPPPSLTLPLSLSLSLSLSPPSEVASHTEALEQKEGEHKTKFDAMTSERAMLEVEMCLIGRFF